MKKINILFEQDDSLECPEVIIRASRHDSQVEEIIAALSMDKTVSIAVNDENNNVLHVSSDDIILISVRGKKLSIITADGKYFVRQSLQSLEESLDADRFIRISRYEIVNLLKVKRYDFTIQGTLRIELDSDIETWASRRCIPVIRKRLEGKEG